MAIDMSYLDEDFLKLKRQEKYAKYSTLETGIYISFFIDMKQKHKYSRAEYQCLLAENICADAAFHC